MIIDSHAHLAEEKDLDGALKRAKAAGVRGIVAVGTDEVSNKKIIELAQNFKGAEEYPLVYPALGVHPANAEKTDLACALAFIEKHINTAVALGEIGLDYWYKAAKENGPGRRLQRELFFQQLQFAVRYAKAVSIHSRAAWRDCWEMTRDSGIKKAVFHWYSGPEDVLGDILKQGYLISAAPSAEYSREHQRVIQLTPLEQLLLETDAPVIFKPEAGKYESEPKDVLRTLRAVAKIKNLDEKKVAEETTKNARRLFAL
ncbi:MAG: TatD family hydrolase [Candidatus Omnitrophota bacterium]